MQTSPRGKGPPEGWAGSPEGTVACAEAQCQGFVLLEHSSHGRGGAAETGQGQKRGWALSEVGACKADKLRRHHKRCLPERRHLLTYGDGPEGP